MNGEDWERHHWQFLACTYKCIYVHGNLHRCMLTPSQTCTYTTYTERRREGKGGKAEGKGGKEREGEIMNDNYEWYHRCGGEAKSIGHEVLLSSPIEGHPTPVLCPCLFPSSSPNSNSIWMPHDSSWFFPSIVVSAGLFFFYQKGISHLVSWSSSAVWGHCVATEHLL